MARHDFWIERLSERLDGDLPDDQERAVDEHLAACADCRRVADDLAEVKRRARALGGVVPPRDLWPGIRARLDRSPDVVDLTLHLDAPPSPPPAEPRAVRGGWRRAAATVALMVGTGAAGWGLRAAVDADRPRGVETASVATESAPAGASMAAAGGADGDPLAAEVSELERLLNAGPAGLDPETVQVLRKNLAIIQTAIAESRDALARDPDNAYVRRHLEGAVARQRAFLRQAASLLADD